MLVGSLHVQRQRHRRQRLEFLLQNGRMVRVQLALEEGWEVLPVVVGVGHVVHDLLPKVGLLSALAVNHLALGLLESGRVRLSL